MPESAISITTITLFIPLVSMFILRFLKEEQAQFIRIGALAGSLLTLGAAEVMWAGVDLPTPNLQFVQRGEWIPT